MYVGDAQTGNIYIGDVLISGGSNGYMLGEVEEASTAKSLSITDIGNYYLQAETFIADLQDMWNWDDDDALTWGCFTVVRNGNNSAGIQDSYTATVNTYGGTLQISEGGQNPTTVKIVKSDKAILIDMSGGVIVLFSATDSNGVERKCAALARNSSDYTIYFAADDGISANVQKKNRASVRTTSLLYELTPFFDGLASGYVEDNTVLAVRSYPGTLANGLYKIGDNQAYLSFFFGMNDV